MLKIFAKITKQQSYATFDIGKNGNLFFSSLIYFF